MCFSQLALFFSAAPYFAVHFLDLVALFMLADWYLNATHVFLKVLCYTHYQVFFNTDSKRTALHD